MRKVRRAFTIFAIIKTVSGDILPVGVLSFGRKRVFGFKWGKGTTAAGIASLCTEQGFCCCKKRTRWRRNSQTHNARETFIRHQHNYFYYIFKTFLTTQEGNFKIAQRSLQHFYSGGFT
jgi:hypothetical protein